MDTFSGTQLNMFGMGTVILPGTEKTGCFLGRKQVNLGYDRPHGFDCHHSITSIIDTAFATASNGIYLTSRHNNSVGAMVECWSILVLAFEHIENWKAEQASLCDTY